VEIDGTNHKPMGGWGLQRDINDVEQTLRFARSVRARTGSPGTGLTLLAWSRGGEGG
jgi:hypothetical protein